MNQNNQDRAEVRQAWICMGCHHMCESRTTSPFVPATCLLFGDTPLKTKGGEIRGTHKWVEVNL